MRRLKRIKRLVALMLSVAVLTNTFNISAYADEEGVYEAEQNATTEAKGWDGVTTKQVYEAENYNVIFNLTGHWSGGYNATVRIENASDEIIHNWYIAYNSSYDISNIWNGEIYQSSEETSIIKNATWNQDIPVGGSVEFGFTGVGEFSGFPTEYKLVTSNAETPTEDYTVEYVLNSDWGSGFSGNICLSYRVRRNNFGYRLSGRHCV